MSQLRLRQYLSPTGKHSGGFPVGVPLQNVVIEGSSRSPEDSSQVFMPRSWLRDIITPGSGGSVSMLQSQELWIVGDALAL